MYKLIEPEVAGGLGSSTIIDSTQHPPVVSKLEYEFMGWMGDDIIESFPCYIVTERLAERIKSNKLTGIEFAEVNVTKSDFFIEMYPDLELPLFCWLKVIGSWGLDDFCISEDHRLAVSKKALNILFEHNLQYATIE